MLCSRASRQTGQCSLIALHATPRLRAVCMVPRHCQKAPRHWKMCALCHYQRLEVGAGALHDMWIGLQPHAGFLLCCRRMLEVWTEQFRLWLAAELLQPLDKLVRGAHKVRERAMTACTGAYIRRVVSGRSR